MAAWWNTVIEKAKNLWQRIVHSRTVRMVRLGVHTVSLPGNKGVPLYDVTRYLLRGIFNGDLWRASKGLAFSFLTALPPLLIFIFTLIAFLFIGLRQYQAQFFTQPGGRHGLVLALEYRLKFP